VLDDLRFLPSGSLATVVAQDPLQLDGTLQLLDGVVEPVPRTVRSAVVSATERVRQGLKTLGVCSQTIDLRIRVIDRYRPRP
jgi:hypothetical protein